jgi:hypothetical protein
VKRARWEFQAAAKIFGKTNEKILSLGRLEFSSGGDIGKLQRLQDGGPFGVIPPVEVNAVRVPEGQENCPGFHARRGDLVQVESVAGQRNNSHKNIRSGFSGSIIGMVDPRFIIIRKLAPRHDRRSEEHRKTSSEPLDRAVPVTGLKKKTTERLDG